MLQASPYMLHGRSEVAPPIVVQTTIINDAHARMDRIEQHMRQLRVSNSSVVWDDLEGMPVASLGCLTLRGTRALVALAFTSDSTA